MNNALDKLYKGIGWLIIGISLLAYFFAQVLVINGDIISTITSFEGILHMFFVVFMNVMVVGLANDKGTIDGLESQEFEKAEELNKTLITFYNNYKERFRNYVWGLNKYEKHILEEDFLYHAGVKTKEELTKKQLRKFKKLKPIKHNIQGFNLPIYYETNRRNEISYDSSYDAKKGKTKMQVKKLITGVLFGSMTINMIADWKNVGAAFVSLIIIAVGLVFNYFMQVYIPYNILKRIIPKKVLNKNNLKLSFESGVEKIEEFTKSLEEKEVIKQNDNQEEEVIKADDSNQETLDKEEEECYNIDVKQKALPNSS